MLEVDSIETPENVLLNRRLAGIGTRFIAGFLDNLILAILLLLLIIAFMILIATGHVSKSTFDDGIDDLSGWAIAFLIVIFFLLYWGYFAFFEYISNGQTPGKKFSHIRVVKREGGPITFTDIAIRNLLRVVDSLPFGYAVGGIFMFITKRCQRLGDLAAGTVVTDESVADYSSTEKRAKRNERKRKKGITDEDMPALEASAEHLRNVQLQPQEYRLLTNYWSRRHELDPAARRRILLSVLTPILQRHGRMDVANSSVMLEQYARHLLIPALSIPSRSAQPSPSPKTNPATPEEGNTL